jgi:hypothetical protein
VEAGGKDHAQIKDLDLDPIQLNPIKVWGDSSSADRGLRGGADAALWVSSTLPLHSPGKGANKTHPECIASDLPQAGCEQPFCRATMQNHGRGAEWME